MKARDWSAGDLALFGGAIVFIHAVRRRFAAAQIENVDTGASSWCPTSALSRPKLEQLRRAHTRLLIQRVRVASLAKHVELAINGRARR